MGSDQVGQAINQVPPKETWERLAKEPDAELIDVRTHAELAFVGAPDISGLGKTLHCVEWAMFPGMSRNQRFAEAVLENIGPNPIGPLFFLCRSGVRSDAAAAVVSAHLRSQGVDVECVNVTEGFEGDLNADGHRGQLNGWKFRGLAWRQS